MLSCTVLVTSRVRSLLIQNDLPEKGKRRLFILGFENFLATLRPLAAIRKSKRVVLFYHHGRCGSTVLANALAQHPDLWSDGEIYLRQWRDKLVGEARQSGFIGRWCRSSFSRAHYIPYLESRSMLAIGRGRYVFEVKPRDLAHLQTTPEAFVRDLEAKFQVSYVLLFRKNFLRKMLSALVAVATRQWHAKASGEKMPMVRHRIPTGVFSMDALNATLIEHFQRFELEQQTIRAALGSRPALSMTYEDDIEHDPKTAYGKVVEFLGLRPFKAETVLRRTNQFPLKDQLENFDEVESLLRNTPYAWMLKDD